MVLANGDLMVTGALTKDGGFEPPLLVARPSGRADQWIARLDRNGVLLWQRLLDVPADLQSVGPMARLPDGRAAVSFTTLRADTEVVVPWAAIVDDDGEVTWQSTPTLEPAPGGKPADGLAARPDGTLILAGGNNYDRNVVDLGTGAVENNVCRGLRSDRHDRRSAGRDRDVCRKSELLSDLDRRRAERRARDRDRANPHGHRTAVALAGDRLYRMKPASVAWNVIAGRAIETR